MKVEDGYISLLSALFLTAIGSAVAVSMLLLGLGSSKSSYVHERSAQARSFANACAEEGLQKIRDDVSFSGSLTINLGEGSCTYTITKLSGQDRRVDSSGTIGTLIRKVKINIDKITPSMNITSWQEVADF